MNEAPGYRPGPEKQFVVEDYAGDLAAELDVTCETLAGETGFMNCCLGFEGLTLTK